MSASPPTATVSMPTLLSGPCCGHDPLFVYLAVYPSAQLFQPQVA